MPYTEQTRYGKTLRLLRVTLGMSQMTLANIFQIADGTLCRIEHGCRAINDMGKRRMARRLSVSRDVVEFLLVDCPKELKNTGFEEIFNDLQDQTAEILISKNRDLVEKKDE